MDKIKESVQLLTENGKIISKMLIEWYHRNKRDLPWRHTKDPYKIWLSEIILQQTRVDQGLNYYLRFIERFPDVKTLALADEEEVLKHWQGLGYYSRARNLHATARTIMTHYGGKFPEEYDQVIRLKGIGEYTAAAILSFVWNKPYPSVDGNVFRFLSRLFAIDEPVDTGKGKKMYAEAARLLMDPSEAGLFNQAIMEFGALQCVPVAPDCRKCPFEDKCMARHMSRVEDYPVKQNRTKSQDRYLYYFHIRFGNCTYLNKRLGKGVWQNLYEFPMVESEKHLPFEILTRTPLFRQLTLEQDAVELTLVVSQKKHILSHRVLYVDFYDVVLAKDPGPDFPFLKIGEGEINDYPIHRLMQFYLER